MVVLDTATLLYWTLQPSSLSAKATSIVRQADEVLISAMSVWEIGIKAKRGHLILPGTLDEYVERIKSVHKIKIVAVDEYMWMENVMLDWLHKDPADRTIVATARIRQCQLVTPDHAILKFYAEAIW
jgi:PIN domain nuclease of toxin-antitoxin system